MCVYASKHGNCCNFKDMFNKLGQKIGLQIPQIECREPWTGGGGGQGQGECILKEKIRRQICEKKKKSRKIFCMIFVIKFGLSVF